MDAQFQDAFAYRLAIPEIAERQVIELACSEFKRACDGVGVLRNDSEQNLRRLIGPMGALLPIAHGPKREMKPRREFLLCQVQFLAQSCHRRHAACTSN